MSDLRMNPLLEQEGGDQNYQYSNRNSQLCSSMFHRFDSLFDATIISHDNIERFE